MWFELASATGGLGIAGFAIMSEMMAAAQNDFSASKQRLQNLFSRGKLNDATTTHGDYKFVALGRDWQPILPDAGQRVPSKLSKRLRWGFNADMIVLPVRKQNGFGYLHWPSVLPVKIDSDTWRYRRQEAMRASTQRPTPKPDEPDVPFFVKAGADLIVKMLQTYERHLRMAWWRRTFIVITAIGWAGALAAAF